VLLVPEATFLKLCAADTLEGRGICVS
jgi:hypothetical protein